MSFCCVSFCVSPIAPTDPLLPCRRDHDKNEKGFRSLTVVAIPKEGWCYAPYKKPKKGAKSVRDPDARPLFEVSDIADRNGQRAIAALQVYSFKREGKTDKGPRNDEQTAELRVGMTIRFKVQSFMYEKKGGREDSRDDVFPPDLDVIPGYSLVEVMVLPGTSESADKNFGLSIAKIRMLPHSLYSYLTPTGLSLLPGSFDAAMELAKQTAERGESIQAMIETQCVSFFAKVDSNAHLTPIGPSMFRLSAGDNPVVESVHEVDVREEDLLRFTNAGENKGYAIFLCDLAASAGALSVLVIRDPYYQVIPRPSPCARMLTDWPWRAAESGSGVRGVPRAAPGQHGEAAGLCQHQGHPGPGRRRPVRPALHHGDAGGALRDREHGARPDRWRRARLPGFDPAFGGGPELQGLRDHNRRRAAGTTLSLSLSFLWVSSV